MSHPTQPDPPSGPDEAPARPARPAPRTVLVAVGYGAVAGAVAGLTFAVMMWLEHTVWSVSDARWYIPVAILVGGLLIAALRRRAGA